MGALRKTFSRRVDVLLFLALFAGAFVLFVLVPVWTTPGNDLAFQWSLLSPPIRAIMFVLAGLNALLISMHAQIRRMRATSSVRETTSSLAVFVGSVFATVGCASCYSSLLSVFGLGGIVFFGKYHYWVSAAVIGVSLWAVWMTARRIEGECARCVT